MSSCYHCSLQISKNSNFHTYVLGEKRYMCCVGCQSIADLIVKSGLENFYKYRSKKSYNQEILPKIVDSEFKLYDDPIKKQSTKGPVVEKYIFIEGINCAACCWLIEKHLNKLKGLIIVSINLSNHKLYIKWNSEKLSISTILKQIKSIGYIGYPYKEDKAAEQISLKQKKTLLELVVAGFLWLQVMMASMATWPEFNFDLSKNMDYFLRWISLFLTTPIIFYSCRTFFKGAFRDLRTLNVTMDLSVSIAILITYISGCFSTIIGHGELYFDSIGMFVFFILTSRYLERRVTAYTYNLHSKLKNVLPVSCIRINFNNINERVFINDLKIHDKVIVYPGTIIPTDGIIIYGRSSINESLLTGEFSPQKRNIGDLVIGGTLNIEHKLIIRVTKLGNDRIIMSIIELLERAQLYKPTFVKIADRIAKFFLFFVLIFTVIIGVIWCVLDSTRAFWIVISLLVSTCPCALSLATPTAITAANGRLHRIGVLVTRNHVIENINKIDTIIFDKTGTLTKGLLKIYNIYPLRDLSKKQCFILASALETKSTHPIANAFLNTEKIAKNVKNFKSLGLEGVVDNYYLRIGNPNFVSSLSNSPTPTIPNDLLGQWILLGDKKSPLAWFCLNDKVRNDAYKFISVCKSLKLQTILLSGDISNIVNDLAKNLNIDIFRSGLTPFQKFKFIKELHNKGHKVLMIGDGINDIPALGIADISIAMGSGTDLAKTTADAILLSNSFNSLIQAFSLSRITNKIIIKNFIWALFYNSMILPLAACGFITPLVASIGMSVSSLLVVMNALRLTFIKVNN